MVRFASAVRQSWEEADKTLRHVLAAFGVSDADVSLDPMLNLVVAMVAAARSDTERAFAACEIVEDQLNAFKRGWRRYRQADIDYMRYYNKTLVIRLCGQVEPDFNNKFCQLALSIPLRFEDLRPPSVRGLVRKQFPMDEAASREFDYWVEQNSWLWSATPKPFPRPLALAAPLRSRKA